MEQATECPICGSKRLKKEENSNMFYFKCKKCGTEAKMSKTEWKNES